MRNPEGTPIWYELLTNDAAASKAFYDTVLGWNVQPPRPGDPHEYRTIDTGKGFVGGMMQLTDGMRSNGAKPTWLMYIGVDDVDATTKKAAEAGAKVLMQPFDIPNVGRAAMFADPQGFPLYVMRGVPDGVSTAFDATGLGKCCWNELTTPAQEAAHAFYTKVFGWTYPDKMEMPGLGDYVFVVAAGTTIGATMTLPPGAPSGWVPYFRAADIDAAAEKVKSGGGTVLDGPMDVPGGDRVVVAGDPHGVRFGIVAKAKT